MTDMLKVQQALRFSSADLSYNRRGARSPAQIKMWEDAEKGCMRYALYIFFGVVALTAVGVLLIQGQERAGVLIVGGLFSAVALGVYFLMRMPTDGLDKVYSITGTSRLSVDRGEDNARVYKMMIDKVDFNIGPALYELLEHDAAYTAYYLKLVSSNHLLSLEKA